MKLVSRSIFIDTQYLSSIAFHFGKEELKSLISLSQAGHVKVYIVDITDEEVKKNIKDDAIKALEKINNSDARILKGISDFWDFLKKYNAQKVAETIINKYQEFKKDCNIRIITSDDITMKQVYQRYADRMPPFGEGAKKYEFPDAFVLLKILKWSYEEDAFAYLLSGDIDWITFAKESWDEDPTNFSTITEKPRLFHLKDLPEFLNLVYKTEAELKDVTAFWESLISKQKEDIEKKFLDLNWKPEWLPITEDEIEVLNAFILQAAIIDTEIVFAEREMAVYNITTDMEMIVIAKREDYSSAIFDREEGIYRGVKQYESAYKTTLPITLQCSFACTEGLEVNFLITHVELPEIQELSLHEEERIDIKEWAKNLRIIIHGVVNNQITEKGDGTQEFDSFPEAHKILPNLSLLKDSNDFFLSQDITIHDLVHGPITYYTAAAIERFFS